jgi:hypothetical protein
MLPILPTYKSTTECAKDCYVLLTLECIVGFGVKPDFANNSSAPKMLPTSDVVKIEKSNSVRKVTIFGRPGICPMVSDAI